MATYQLANNETIIKTPIEELAFDLARGVSNHETTTRVMTADLAMALHMLRRAEHYLRRCASNCPEANALLKLIEGRTDA